MLLSKISNQFQYSLDKKTNLDLNPNIELNPFRFDENSLLAYNYSLKNVFYINRYKQNYSLAFSFLENKSKSNFSFGSTKSSSKVKKLNFIYRLKSAVFTKIIN